MYGKFSYNPYGFKHRYVYQRPYVFYKRPLSPYYNPYGYYNYGYNYNFGCGRRFY